MVFGAFSNNRHIIWMGQVPSLRAIILSRTSYAGCQYCFSIVCVEGRGVTVKRSGAWTKQKADRADLHDSSCCFFIFDYDSIICAGEIWITAVERYRRTQVLRYLYLERKLLVTVLSLKQYSPRSYCYARSYFLFFKSQAPHKLSTILLSRMRQISLILLQKPYQKLWIQ